LSLSKPVAAAVLALFALVLAAAGCGSSGSDTPTVLKIGIGEKGKAASFSAPKSASGGLVEVKLTNEGKAPHGVQFVRYTGNHSEQEALKEVAGESKKTPDWLRAEGGVGSVGPGEVGKATLNLEAGNFLLIDTAAFSGEGGPPATDSMKVSQGESGDLPDTGSTVTAEETGKDKYAWNFSGLKAGKDEVTFNSEGDKALHLIFAVPVKGKVPPVGTIEKELAKQGGPPPSYVDFGGAQNTAILDGGKSQTTTLHLKPGRYLFFCPLTDRDGGKSHFEEGLLAVETVK
jgi:hypothetical protein